MFKENDTQFAGEILTIKEVAQYLRRSEAKVYRLVNEGQLPVIRLGKAWRFRKDLLDEWFVEQSRVELHAEQQERPDGNE